jgi:tellurite resistance protein TerC
MHSGSMYQWAILGFVVAGALAADLLIFHRDAHVIRFKEAIIESTCWIALALAFCAWVYFSRGHEAGLQFLTAYVVEKSLSFDNIFVFILIFASLGVPARSQHKVLFYGVAGALVLRGVFVLAGVELLQKFHSVLYVFGAILLITGVRMLLPGRQAVRPERNWLVQLARVVLPVVGRYEDDRLVVKDDGQWKATSLFVALVAVEAMDIIFAVDSVPAVLAITREPFIAYSSNAFAILGLRALYFALSGALTRLRYLHRGLAFILLFVAAKMIAGDRLHLSTGASLGVVGGIIVLMVVASTLPWRKRKR